MAVPVLILVGFGVRQVISWLFKNYIKKQLKKKAGKTAIKEVRKLLLKELEQLLPNVKGRTAELVKRSIEWVKKASDDELIGLLDPVGEVIELGFKKAGKEIHEMCNAPKLGEKIKLEGEPTNSIDYHSPYTPQRLHEVKQTEQKGIPFGTIIKGRYNNQNLGNPFKI